MHVWSVGGSRNTWRKQTPPSCCEATLPTTAKPCQCQSKKEENLLVSFFLSKQDTINLSIWKQLRQKLSRRMCENFEQPSCLTHSPPLKKTGSIQVSFSFFFNKVSQTKDSYYRAINVCKNEIIQISHSEALKRLTVHFFFYGLSERKRKPHVLLPWNDKLRAMRVNMQSCQR